MPRSQATSPAGAQHIDARAPLIWRPSASAGSTRRRPAHALGMGRSERELGHRLSGADASVDEAQRPRKEHIVLEVHVDVHGGFEFR